VPADQHLAVIRDAHLVAHARRADGRRDFLERVTGPGQGDRPGLRQAVPGEDRPEGQLGADPADELDRDVGGPVTATRSDERSRRSRADSSE
jgi:hypothetical protein